VPSIGDFGEGAIVKRAWWAIGSVCLLVGCGASDPLESDEYRTLSRERDDLRTEAEDLQVQADDLRTEIDALREEAATAAAVLEDERDEAITARDAARAERDAAEAERDGALAEGAALRLQFDPQIRAGLQAGVDAEVVRACQAAIADPAAEIAGLVQYDVAWEPVASEQTLIDSVNGCAAPERAKSAEQREMERLAACQTIEVDAVVRNPAAYEGTCVVLFASIVQFDTNTGPCSFHANIAAEFHDRSYEYDERSTFGYDDSELVSSLNATCPQLDGVDVDDFVKLWVTGLGSFDYSTSIGGSNTVPSFRIERVELVQKA
jgi:hypothetical protein